MNRILIVYYLTSVESAVVGVTSCLDLLRGVRDLAKTVLAIARKFLTT
jgi:hypothetical protein